MGNKWEELGKYLDMKKTRVERGVTRSSGPFATKIGIPNFASEVDVDVVMPHTGCV
jgi:hypothetical protein